MIGPFLIVIIAGLFFLACVVAIDRIADAVAARHPDTGAPEGDLRHFNLRALEDEFRREEL